LAFGIVLPIEQCCIRIGEARSAILESDRVRAVVVALVLAGPLRRLGADRRPAGRARASASPP